MILHPIIPTWIMAIISIVLIMLLIKKWKKNWPLLAIIVLLFAINLRIMIPNNNSEILSNNLDILFVIDNTISMNAIDYDNNMTRLEALKKDCKFIIKSLNGARFSIITFNNNSKIMIPYTKDANITNEAIEIIKPINEIYATGSSLNTPKNTIIESLKSATQTERKQIIFFISDGEITNNSTLENYSDIASNITNGAVLGYGTTKGAYMKSVSSEIESDFVLDRTNYPYVNAISKLDENNLQKIADDLKIDYIQMNKQSNINNKIKEIKSETRSNLETSNLNSYEDTYFFLILPIVVLIFIYLKRSKL